MTPPAKNSYRGLLLLMTAYLVIGIPASCHARYLLEVDGLAYIQVARHYAAGELGLAVNGYWSPLFSWLLILPVKLGANPLTAIHLLTMLCGLLWVVGAWLLAGRFALSASWRLGAGGIAGLLAIVGGVRGVYPDILSAGILLLYLYAVTSEDWFESPRGACVSGLLGGLAFLSKAFNAPFFVAHFTAVVLLRCWCAGWRGHWRPGLRRWLAGMALGACLIVPWVGLLSLKYGKPTVSNAGAANHALVGPADIHRWHPWISGLWPPAEGRLTVWEDPSDIPYKTWSPFASRAYFMHQLRVMGHGIGNIFEAIAEHDPLLMRWWILFGLIAHLWRKRADRSVLWLDLSVLAAVAIHIAGYLPVQCWQERYHYLIGILLMVYGLHLLNLMTSARWQRVTLLVGLLYFILPPARYLHSWSHLVQRGVEFRLVADDMARHGCAGPLASTNYNYGLYVGWHLNMVALGQPQAKTLAALRTELRQHGVRTFILWREGDPPWDLDQASWLEKLSHHPRGSLRGLRWDTTVYRVRQ